MVIMAFSDRLSVSRFLSLAESRNSSRDSDETTQTGAALAPTQTSDHSSMKAAQTRYTKIGNLFLTPLAYPILYRN